MVDRNSSDPTFGQSQGVQAQQSQAGYSRPDADAYSETRQIDAATNPQSSGDRILMSIMGAAGKIADGLAEQHIKTSREEAYLQGQAAATLGQTEVDLQEDIFTKDWAKAGFRDTMGRISLADNASKVIEDMPRLREMAPEDFSNYMTDRRSKLMPSLEGMSQEARKSVFSTMALNERAVFAQQAGEHRKFVWEQQVASIHAQNGASKSALDVAAGIESPGPEPLDAYNKQTEATLGTMHQLIVANPNVPIAARSQLIYEAAADALQSNHQKLYQMMKTQPLPNGDGTMSTLMDQLSSTDRAKLEGAYRESRGRTAGAASVNTLMEIAQKQAEWDAPNIPLQPREEVKAMIENAFKNGYLGAPDSPTGEAATKAAGIWKQYAEAALKKQGKFEIGGAWLKGDVNTIRAYGKTNDEALESWQQSTGRLMPMDQNVNTLVTAGLANGQYEGLTLAGKLMTPAWNRLMTNPDIDPTSATLVAGVLGKLGKETAAGHPAAMQSYLRSFDTDTQEMILQVQSNQAKGAGPTEAVLQAQSTMMERRKIDPTMRAAMAGNTAKENAELVAGMEAKGGLSNWWQGNVKAMFSSAAGNKAAINVKSGWFENPARIADAQAIVKYAKAEELDALSRSNPYADKDARDKMSDAAVAARTTMTSWGPMVVPKGQTLETYFGVRDSQRVGAVLSEMVAPKNPDNRITFQTGANGELLFKELNASGGTARVGHIDPMSVKQAVKEARDAEVEKINVQQGAGKTVNVQGIPVNFSGANSLNIDPAEMFAFRARLIKHEGVTDTPKDDIGGSINKKTGKTVQTGGVGLSDTNTFFPKGLQPGQKMTPQQISDGLRDSSEEAAKTAQHWLVATGSTLLTRRTPLFQLFGELAYQGGGNNKAYGPLLVGVRDNSLTASMAALKATPAYQMSGAERRKFYEDTLTKALK